MRRPEAKCKKKNSSRNCHRKLTSLRLDGPDADFPLILDNVFAASVVLIDSGLD